MQQIFKPLFLRYILEQKRLSLTIAQQKNMLLKEQNLPINMQVYQEQKTARLWLADHHRNHLIPLA